MTSIVTLYHGSGASGWSSGEPAYPVAKTAKLFEACAKWLDHDVVAQGIDSSGKFELRHGINDFSDDFLVLTRRVGLDEFLQFQDEAQLSAKTPAYSNIAQAFKRMGLFVRFIGVELTLEDEITPVESPELSKTLAPVVAAALSDAETLIPPVFPGGLCERKNQSLPQPEALLVANTARTILRYLSDKIGNPEP